MRDVRRFTILSCAIAALAACASYEPAPISPEQNAEAIDARSLDDDRLQKFIAAALALDGERIEAPPSWDLTRLTLAAVYYHPNLDIARAKLAEARAHVATAAQVPNPSLSFEELS